ncbi:hypothetical protein MAP00_004006 [Monascus purpureus]|nr:hypothetical protein MAP00_004006 [Monascus purpureus]
MTVLISGQFLRPTVRYFSVRRPQPVTRASRAVTMFCLVSAVVIPFIPPAIESSREKRKGYPNHNKPLPPLCFHAR